MDFEREYSTTIAGFTNFVAARPQRVYLAPGESAGEMVGRMKAHAKSESIALPDIHVLTHDESWILYGGLKGGGEEARKLVKPYIQGSRPKRLYFLEDHYWEAEKIRKIVDRLVINHAIVSHFLVMVGSDKDHLSSMTNVETFTQNNTLAYILYNLYNRRKK